MIHHQVSHNDRQLGSVTVDLWGENEPLKFLFQKLTGDSNG